MSKQARRWIGSCYEQYLPATTHTSVVLACSSCFHIPAGWSSALCPILCSRLYSCTFTPVLQAFLLTRPKQVRTWT